MNMIQIAMEDNKYCGKWTKNRVMQFKLYRLTLLRHALPEDITSGPEFANAVFYITYI